MNALLTILTHLWGEPKWLWGLSAVPGVLVVFLIARKRRRMVLARLGNVRLLTGLAGLSEGLRWLRVTILALGLGFAVLAAARPQWGTITQLVKSEGIDIVILLDTSLSMLAQDVAPNRLAAAKHEIAAFLDGLTSDRVALVPFAGSAFVQCPLTLDYSAAKLFLDDITVYSMPDEGTALGTAIRVALRAFVRDTDQQRVMVLITDGEDHGSDPIGAAQQAAEQGVRIYTIGIGSPDGELIPQQGPGGRTEFLRDADGRVVKTRLDEPTLQRIAVGTGGRYYRSTAGEMELDEILRDIRGLATGAHAEEQVVTRVDRYQWPLAASVILLLLVPFIPDRRGRAGRRVGMRVTAAVGVGGRMSMLVIVVGMASLGLVACQNPSLDWRDPVSRKVAQGNRHFAEGRVSDALTSYRDAQIDAPAAAEVHFNIGHALYRQRKYEEAEEAFMAAEAKGTKELRARAAYNAGNSHFRQQKLDKAAESYQRALELNPGDMDAKFNLELVQRLLNQAAQRAADAQKGDPQRPKVSEWARRRAHEAEALAQQGRYVEADQIMQRTIHAEPAAGELFGDFAERLSDLASILGRH